MRNKANNVVLSDAYFWIIATLLRSRRKRICSRQAAAWGNQSSWSMAAMWQEVTKRPSALSPTGILPLLMHDAKQMQDTQAAIFTHQTTHQGPR